MTLNRQTRQNGVGCPMRSRDGGPRQMGTRGKEGGFSPHTFLCFWIKWMYCLFKKTKLTYPATFGGKMSTCGPWPVDEELVGEDPFPAECCRPGCRLACQQVTLCMGGSWAPVREGQETRVGIRQGQVMRASADKVQIRISSPRWRESPKGDQKESE